MKTHSILTKVLAYTLSVTTTLLPLYGIAAQEEINLDDFFSQIGKDAQVFGQDLASDALFSAPTVEDGQLIFDGGGTLNVQDLYPGTSADNSDKLNEYFPDGVAPNVSDLQSMHDSEGDMDRAGTDAKDSLWEDAFSDAPSISGAAYRVLLDSSNLSRPDFTNDPMLDLTKSTFDNIDLIADGFGDCSAETVFDEITMPVHKPQYETCERVTDKSGGCEITHDYEAAVVKYHDGPFNLSECAGEYGCSDLWIGTVGDNYWSGNCSIFEEYTEIKVVNPDAITSATLVRAKWDDYMQIWIGEPGKEKKVWQGPNNDFPPETAGACELATSWDENPNLDLTQYFKNAPEDSVLRFKIRVSVTGAGEGFGKIQIKYDPSKAIIRDEWGTDSCIETALGVSDGFAQGEYSCIDDPRDAEGCTFTNGIKICEQSLKPAPLPGVPNLCKKVDVRADYDFYKGDMECFIDATGEEVCPVNEGGNLNTCTAYEDNPQCGFISSGCVDGAEGSSGSCYVQEEIWDCGTSVDIGTIEKKTEYQCAGAIRCMGADCIDPSQSQNQSANFAKASALLNAAQFMTQDMTCTGQDEGGGATGNENVMCTAFNGMAGECKIAVGGVSDCCEKPSNIGMQEYLAMVMAVPKLDKAIGTLGEDNIVRSAYQTIKAPVMESWSTVTKPFTSQMDNISGAVTEMFSPVTELKNQLMSELNKQMSQVIQEVLGGVAQDAATQAGAAQATDGMSQKTTENVTTGPASTMLGTVMAAYTAYVVAVAVIQMVYACEQEEFEMNAKRATDSCTYVGSYCNTKVLGVCIEKREAYCCFSSPLSRIIQEQVKGQLGQTFGSAKSPSCEGIPLDKIGDINWDEINLDEWLALLQQNGQFPTVDGVSMDSLTGSGSVYDIDGNRLPADQRALERIEGIDVDAKRREAMDMVPITPRSGWQN